MMQIDYSDYSPAALLRIDWESAGELAAALQEIVPGFPHIFSQSEPSLPLSFKPLRLEQTGASVSVSITDGGAEIGYSSISSALRGIAHLIAQRNSAAQFAEWSDSSPFTTRGAMVDASRNAVPTVATLKQLVRRMAMMGLNQLLLYCEDTYEIASEPFFGYYRGRYSQAELREIDTYALQFGIEVVLCIQTLGHLEQMLQWPCYRHLRDTSHILLAEDDASYAFIGKMLDAAASSLSSRRVHIGMDEAHGIGSGAHRLKKGLKPPFEILSAHLERVAALCEERGLKPMIWSDMFFRLGSASNSYYDAQSTVPANIAERIPPNTDLVYWDYYHREQSFCEEWIRRHDALGHKPIFATGLWTWGRFWTALPYALEIVRSGLEAARRQNVTEVFATLWCDDGAEIDLLSSLPALQYFAEKCYGGDEDQAAQHFHASTGSCWDDWMMASQLDIPVGEPNSAANLSKWLLWHDPLLGFLNAGIASTTPAHYASLAKRLDAAGGGSRLQFPLKIAKALALKSTIHRDLRAAYQARDFIRLTQMLAHEIPALMRAVDDLKQAHHRVWQELYKPFGWEVIDVRYGGLIVRLKTLEATLTTFLNDTQRCIPELEVAPAFIAFEEDPIEGVNLTWARSITPTAAP